MDREHLNISSSEHCDYGGGNLTVYLLPGASVNECLSLPQKVAKSLNLELQTIKLTESDVLSNEFSFIFEKDIIKEKIISPPVFCNGIYIPNSALGISYDQVHSGALKILQRNETISVFVSKMGLTTPLNLRLEPSICLASLKQEISYHVKIPTSKIVLTYRGKIITTQQPFHAYLSESPELDCYVVNGKFSVEEASEADLINFLLKDVLEIIERYQNYSSSKAMNAELQYQLSVQSYLEMKLDVAGQKNDDLKLLLQQVSEKTERLCIAHNEDLKDQYHSSKEEIIEKMSYLTEKLKSGASNQNEKIVDLFQISRLSTPSEEDQMKSKEILSQIKEDDTEDEKFILHALSGAFHDQGIEVLFTEEEDIQRDMGMHLVTSSDISKEVWHATIDETPQFNFMTIDKVKFSAGFQDHLAKELNIPPENVVILGIEKGSVKVFYEIIDANQNVITNIDGTIMSAAVQTVLDSVQPGQTVQVQRHPVFRHCNLSTNSLDTRGNYDFRNYADVQRRGGHNYYQPLGWKRYGIKVWDKYCINGTPNNDWISMNGVEGEWAVGFHGTLDAAADPICQQGFNAGGGQAYANDICTITNQLCGVGVYLSPHIESAEQYCRQFRIGNNNYKLAFQCRLEPSAIRIPAKGGDTHTGEDGWDNDYWIVNNSQDIRPYGILLKKV